MGCVSSKDAKKHGLTVLEKKAAGEKLISKNKKAGDKNDVKDENVDQE